MRDSDFLLVLFIGETFAGKSRLSGPKSIRLRIKT
jgi:hypothetical protein